MKKQFTDIYSLLGVDKDSDRLLEESEEVLEECVDMYDDNQIEDVEMRAVEEAINLIRDEEKRSEYNSKGHDKYVLENDTMLSQINFVGGSDIYEDFYDLFDLDKNDKPRYIQKQTAIKIKNMHPDKSEDKSVTTDQFNTLKIARQVLTDEKKRGLYDDKGHNEYVQDHIDADLRGFAFTGRGSITESVNEQNKLNNADVSDLIKFSSRSTQSDPTMTATKQDSSNPSIEGTSSSSDTIAEAVKKRKETRGSKRTATADSSENEQTDHLKGGSIIVSILNMMTSIVSVILLSSFILSGVTYILFLTIGTLGVGIGAILFIGTYLIILKKR